MRIKTKDKLSAVYLKTEAVTSEGVKTFTFTTTYNISIDLQPVNSDSTLQAYGLQKDEARIGFVDSSSTTPIGSVIKSDMNFEVVGIEDWYDHSELILKRYEGSV